MNDYAQQIGMKNSRFENASGLPHDDQYTTAKDTALLSSAMIREFPVLLRSGTVRKSLHITT